MKLLQNKYLILLFSVVMVFPLWAQQDIIGTWTGIEINNPRGGEWTFIFGVTSLEITGPSEYYIGTYTVDTSVTPHHLDFHITDCFIEGYIGTTALAIYEVNGDLARWSGSEPGKQIRPLTFEDASRNFDLTRQIT